MAAFLIVGVDVIDGSRGGGVIVDADHDRTFR